MSRSAPTGPTRRRRVGGRTALGHAVAVGAAVLAVSGLPACAAGRDAQTAREYGPVDAATARAEALRIQNAFIAPPTGSVLPAGSDARLFFVVANPTGRSDRLVRVQAEGVRSVQLTGPVEIPPHTLVSIGAAPQQVTLVGLARPLRPGQTLDVALTFADAGRVSLTVPVELKEGPAATIVPQATAPGAAPTGIARSPSPATPGPVTPSPGGEAGAR